MIRHVVLIKFKDDAPEDAKDKLVQGLRALPEKISEIKYYDVGFDIVKGPNSATVGLVSDFQSLETLESYKIHPAHVEVVENLIKPYLEKITAVDFERE